VLLEGIAIAIFTFVLAVDAVKAILAIFKTEYAEEVMSYW
jgi:hypothetical protein